MSMEEKLVGAVKDLQRRVEELEQETVQLKQEVAQLQRMKKGDTVLTRGASDPATRGKPITPGFTDPSDLG